MATDAQRGSYSDGGELPPTIGSCARAAEVAEAAGDAAAAEAAERAQEPAVGGEAPEPADAPAGAGLSKAELDPNGSPAPPVELEHTDATLFPAAGLDPPPAFPCAAGYQHVRPFLRTLDFLVLVSGFGTPDRVRTGFCVRESSLPPEARAYGLPSPDLSPPAAEAEGSGGPAEAPLEKGDRVYLWAIRPIEVVESPEEGPKVVLEAYLDDLDVLFAGSPGGRLIWYHLFDDWRPDAGDLLGQLVSGPVDSSETRVLAVTNYRQLVACTLRGLAARPECACGGGRLVQNPLVMAVYKRYGILQKSLNVYTGLYSAYSPHTWGHNPVKGVTDIIVFQWELEVVQNGLTFGESEARSLSSNAQWRLPSLRMARLSTGRRIDGRNARDEGRVAPPAIESSCSSPGETTFLDRIFRRRGGRHGDEEAGAPGDSELQDEGAAGVDSGASPPPRRKRSVGAALAGSAKSFRRSIMGTPRGGASASGAASGSGEATDGSADRGAELASGAEAGREAEPASGAGADGEVGPASGAEADREVGPARGAEADGEDDGAADGAAASGAGVGAAIMEPGGATAEVPEGAADRVAKDEGGDASAATEPSSGAGGEGAAEAQQPLRAGAEEAAEVPAAEPLTSVAEINDPRSGRKFKPAVGKAIKNLTRARSGSASPRKRGSGTARRRSGKDPEDSEADTASSPLTEEASESPSLKLSIGSKIRKRFSGRSRASGPPRPDDTDDDTDEGSATMLTASASDLGNHLLALGQDGGDMSLGSVGSDEEGAGAGDSTGEPALGSDEEPDAVAGEALGGGEGSDGPGPKKKDRKSQWRPSPLGRLGKSTDSLPSRASEPLPKSKKRKKKGDAPPAGAAGDAKRKSPWRKLRRSRGGEDSSPERAPIPPQVRELDLSGQPPAGHPPALPAELGGEIPPPPSEPAPSPPVETATPDCVTAGTAERADNLAAFELPPGAAQVCGCGSDEDITEVIAGDYTPHSGASFAGAKGGDPRLWTQMAGAAAASAAGVREKIQHRAGAASPPSAAEGEDGGSPSARRAAPLPEPLTPPSPQEQTPGRSPGARPAGVPVLPPRPALLRASSDVRRAAGQHAAPSGGPEAAAPTPILKHKGQARRARTPPLTPLQVVQKSKEAESLDWSRVEAAMRRRALESWSSTQTRTVEEHRQETGVRFVVGETSPRSATFLADRRESRGAAGQSTPPFQQPTAHRDR